MGRLIRIAADRGPRRRCWRGCATRGSSRTGSSSTRDLLLDYLSPFVEPTKVERFRFSREWMRTQFQRINNPREPTYTVAMKLNLPPSYLLIHRTWLGGIGVLSQLEAEAPFREILTEYLPGFAEPADESHSVSSTPAGWRSPCGTTARSAGPSGSRRDQNDCQPACSREKSVHVRRTRRGSTCSSVLLLNDRRDAAPAGVDLGAQPVPRDLLQRDREHGLVRRAHVRAEPGAAPRRTPCACPPTTLRITASS